MTKRVLGMDRKKQDDERLLQLFWNRAALKGEFRRLREQRYRLEESLKQQQQATLAAESRLEALEKLFASPGVGFNAIVYYQLRNLWNKCAAQLRKFASDLLSQREEVERRNLVARFNKDRMARMSELAQEMDALAASVSRLKKQMKSQHAALESQRGLLAYFKRRTTRAELARLGQELEPLKGQYDQLGKQQALVAATQPPDYSGVSIKGKRMVNLAVIAMAQQFHRHYSAQGYADLARDSIIIPLEETRYGTREQCIHLMDEIQAAVERWTADKSMPSTVKRIAEGLMPQAVYLTDEDTIPRAESMDQAAREAAVDHNRTCNVLAQDFWDLYSALVR